jgi:hypothetical protein
MHVTLFLGHFEVNIIHRVPKSNRNSVEKFSPKLFRPNQTLKNLFIDKGRNKARC